MRTFVVRVDCPFLIGQERVPFLTSGVLLHVQHDFIPLFFEVTDAAATTVAAIGYCKAMRRHQGLGQSQFRFRKSVLRSRAPFLLLVVSNTVRFSRLSWWV